MEEIFLKKIHHLAEKFDKFSDLVFIQSMAGGTGSGVGSYALTVLADSF